MVQFLTNDVDRICLIRNKQQIGNGNFLIFATIFKDVFVFYFIYACREIYGMEDKLEIKIH
jgi:hypothetical protein